MKNLCLVTLIILFTRFNNSKDQDGKSQAIGTAIKLENNTEISSVTTNIDVLEIIGVLEKSFKIDDKQLKEVFKPRETAFYKLIDSNQIKRFKKLDDFILIEFKNSKVAIEEFSKMKSVAKKAIKNKRELHDYYAIFGKGGTSYNKVGNWIVGHNLRCSMYPKDYQIDKALTEELKSLDPNLDWIRSYCGWGKIEVNLDE